MKQQWIDEYFMRLALGLALRGTGQTAPNPMVGCVIVKDGRILGRGWHDHAGGLHAEAAARGVSLPAPPLWFVPASRAA